MSFHLAASGPRVHQKPFGVRTPFASFAEGSWKTESSSARPQLAKALPVPMKVAAHLKARGPGQLGPGGSRARAAGRCSQLLFWSSARQSHHKSLASLYITGTNQQFRSEPRMRGKFHAAPASRSMPAPWRAFGAHGRVRFQDTSQGGLEQVICKGQVLLRKGSSGPGV